MPLVWCCNYCPEVFPHFKGLVDHYKEKHEGKLNRYSVVNIIPHRRALTLRAGTREPCGKTTGCLEKL